MLLAALQPGSRMHHFHRKLNDLIFMEFISDISLSPALRADSGVVYSVVIAFYARINSQTCTQTPAKRQLKSP